VRRRGPRPLSAALEGVVADAAPPTLLARVQASWPETVGAAVAAEAQPVSERGGALTVTCRSGTWANELELLAPELLGRLNAALGGTDGGPLTSLRAKVGRLPRK
jgi:predicted nucleic acid-binding Zn ribbon protein